MLRNKKIYVTPILAFLFLIVIIAFVLKLPICNKVEISYIDAIFESASNVTATGLNVIDISQQFTFIGQLVILVGMQIGAIGFMLFFSLLFMVSKKKLKLSDTIFLENEINTGNFGTIRAKARKITKYTLVIELFGAWFLALKFIPMYGFADGLWYSVFHSVSAFCNVGSDLFGSSLEIFRDDIYIKCVFIVLMFLGSIGFFVLEDFTEWFFTGKRNKIHAESKLVLVVTLILIIANAILINIFDRHLSILDSVFSVVTARNAGFYIVDMNELHEMSRFIIAIIMFIGGGPGSNAGGIRVMVFAILILSTIASIKNRDEVVVFYRSINDKMIKKAVSIFVVDLFIVFVGMVGLTITENIGVLDTLFLSVSSFSNTGLSTINTADLTEAGKIISTVIMYVGRIAPMTILSLFVPTDNKKAGIRYPNMDVIL